MLPLRDFRTRTFTGAQFGTFTVSALSWRCLVYITFCLQDILGEDACA